MTIAFYAAHGVIDGGGCRACVGFIASLASRARSSAGIPRGFGFADAAARSTPRTMFVFIFTFVVSEFVAYMAMLHVRHLAENDLPAVVLAGHAGRQHRGECMGRAGDRCRRSARCALLLALHALHAHRGSSWSRSRTIPTSPSSMASTRTRSLPHRHADRRRALIAVGMFLYGTRAQVQPLTGLELMLFATLATIIGGIGNVWGAALAAIVLGVVQNASILFIPSEWQGFLLYVFLFVPSSSSRRASGCRNASRSFARKIASADRDAARRGEHHCGSAE